MQTGELLRLRWSDVAFKDSTFKVTSYKGKTVKTRVVPITDRLRDALLDLRAEPSPSAFRRLKNGELPDQTLVFGIVSNIKRSFDGARLDVGLPDLHFHDLRHTTGTTLSTAGMSPALVGEILGHSDPKTTYRYINRTSDTVSDAAEIMNARQNVRSRIRKLGGQVRDNLRDNAERPFCRDRKLLKSMVPPARFQRATFRLGGGRSMQLSYGSMKRQ